LSKFRPKSSAKLAICGSLLKHGSCEVRQVFMPAFDTWYSVAAAGFWICAGLVLYVYAVYPALIWSCSRLFGGTREPSNTTGPLPFVSIVIAAHNEEAVIAERLENLLNLDYPRERLEIIIASDGSTDRTCEIVRGFDSHQIRLLDFPENRGKVAVLNDAVQHAIGDVLVMSDANTMMDAASTRFLARWFADPEVAVVCGRLVLLDPATGRNVDGMYWKYETFMKASEARLDALLGANGAIYAIRRANFPSLPHRIAVDDFVIPLLARLRSHGRLVYEPLAVAREESPAEIRDEFSRRSRIGAGGFQSLSFLWPLLSPMHGWLSLSFISHKVLRWLCPFFLVGLAVSSVLLAASPIYRFALIVQASLYLVALGGYASSKPGFGYRLARLSTMFVVMNLALLVGFFQWVSGRQSGVWRRTARTGV
jgi:cellulose synthase/poly-beta-1,6-N-acetylglucosamine synthase-like glycosyltransferase